MIHLLLAKHNSQAGKEYNKATIEYLTKLMGRSGIRRKSKKNFWSRLIENMEKYLQPYLMPPSDEMEVWSEHFYNGSFS